MPHNHNGQKWIRNEKRCAIYARDHFRCVYCQEKGKRICLDHIDPDGGNGEENLVACCWDCNHDKGSETLEEWLTRRASRGEPLEALWRVRQRVAVRTFLPIDRSLGKRLNKKRSKGEFVLMPAYRRVEPRKVLRHESALHAGEVIHGNQRTSLGDGAYTPRAHGENALRSREARPRHTRAA